MVPSFELSDSSGENSLFLKTSMDIDFNKALHSIHSTSQIRSMTSTEKLFSLIIFLAKIIMSTFNLGKSLKGFRVGHKSVEKGIVVG